MGLFDKLLGGQGSANTTLNKQEAFAGILMATVAADGHISEDEVRSFNAIANRVQLFKAQSGDEFSAMIDKLMGLLQKHGQSFLIEKSAEALPSDLRETVFATATDLVLADGSVEEEEKKLLERLQVSLKVSDELAVKIIEVLQIKNRG